MNRRPIEVGYKAPAKNKIQYKYNEFLFRHYTADNRIIPQVFRKCPLYDKGYIDTRKMLDGKIKAILIHDVRRNK